MSPRRTKTAAIKTAAILGSALATIAVGISLASAAAGTSSPSDSPGPTASPGFPTFVHLPADQAGHLGFVNEWWYVVGHIRAGADEYGYEVQLDSAGVAEIGFTDMTTGTYASHQYAYLPLETSISDSSLDVRMPDASLSGPLDDMHLTANLPNGMGTLNLALDATGPTLYDNGTGLFPFLGGTSYYYSLPWVQTTGTLTLSGKSTSVSGTSWLDRQWGNWNWDALNRWTWMALQLSNGRALNLWDLFDTSGETHWATVLNPDGSEQVVSVDPLAPDATDFQTSSTTAQRYAGKWTVEIPSLRAKLVVTATPVLQEIDAGLPFSPGIDEAASTAAGTYGGRPVTGNAYVEQFGNWK
jgi:predicted secreted hydrolase